jgi:hypothetical protein
MSETWSTSMMYLFSATEWPPFLMSERETLAALAATTAQRTSEVVNAFILSFGGLAGREAESCGRWSEEGMEKVVDHATLK